jgi:hypothetical protein
VDLQITPEPAPDERRAVAAALERLLTPPALGLPAQYRSAWRRAGIAEATGATTAETEDAREPSPRVPRG